MRRVYRQQRRKDTTHTDTVSKQTSLEAHAARLPVRVLALVALPLLAALLCSRSLSPLVAAQLLAAAFPLRWPPLLKKADSEVGSASVLG